jgi:4-amino-4-deoxy-L-arabinose transferase-like glycosyltransferase
MINLRRKPRHMAYAGAALAWAVLILAIYYRQVWQILFGRGWGHLEAGAPYVLALLPALLLGAAAAAVGIVVVRHRFTGRGLRAGWGMEAALLLGALGFLGVTILADRHRINRTLPYLGEALGREAPAIGAALILLAAAVGLGLLLSRALRWQYAGWDERLPLAAALGIGGLAYLGIALAAIGWYRPPVLQGIVAVVLLAAVLFEGPGAVRQLRTVWRQRQGALRRGANPLWLAAAGLALACAAVGALAPESQYDALWYHLAYPQRYLAAGFFVDVPHDFVSLYPMTTSLWYGYGLALGGANAAILLHYGFLLFSAAATVALAQRGAPGAPPLLAVALVVTAPTVVWLGTTANIDLAMMLFVTLALYALLRYGEEPRAQWLVLAGLNLGFALGSKHLALFALALFCPGLLLLLWRQGAGRRRALGAAFALGCLSLLVALPWYARSYVATGNPVFQLLPDVFGYLPGRWTPENEAELSRFLNNFGRARTPANILTLPWDVTMHSFRYGGTLGPLFLLLLPLLLLRRLRGAMPWLVALAGLWLLLWSLPMASYELRHLMPIVPALAVLAAAAFGRGAALARAAGGRRAPAGLAVGLAVLMVVNLPPFTFLHEGDRVEWEHWLSSVVHVLPVGVVIGGEAEDAYLTRQVRSYAVWQAADRMLPAEARVLTWSGGEQFYTHRHRLWANSAPAIQVAWAPPGEEEKVLEELRRLGITHLIVDRRWPEAQRGPGPWNGYAVTGAEARAQWYEELHGDDWYVLWRVRWEEMGE